MLRNLWIHRSSFLRFGQGCPALHEGVEIGPAVIKAVRGRDVQKVVQTFSAPHGNAVHLHWPVVESGAHTGADPPRICQRHGLVMVDPLVRQSEEEVTRHGRKPARFRAVALHEQGHPCVQLRRAERERDAVQGRRLPPVRRQPNREPIMRIAIHTLADRPNSAGRYCEEREQHHRGALARPDGRNPARPPVTQHEKPAWRRRRAARLRRWSPDRSLSIVMESQYGVKAAHASKATSSPCRRLWLARRLASPTRRRDGQN